MNVKTRCSFAKCGHKLPCRKHTIKIDVTSDPPKVKVPPAVMAAMTEPQREQLNRVVEAIARDRKAKRERVSKSSTQ